MPDTDNKRFLMWDPECGILKNFSTLEEATESARSTVIHGDHDPAYVYKLVKVVYVGPLVEEDV